MPIQQRRQPALVTGLNIIGLRHKKIPEPLRLREAPQVGLEPTTLRLTAECSAIELLRNMESGSDLLSRAVSSQVPSALKGLTSVFGMGTGVTPSLSPPERVIEVCAVLKSSWLLPRYSVTEQSSLSSSVQLLPLPVSLSSDTRSIPTGFGSK